MIHDNERLPRLTDDSLSILADLARDSQPDAGAAEEAQGQREYEAAYTVAEMPRKPFQRKEYFILRDSAILFTDLTRGQAEAIAAELNTGKTFEEVFGWVADDEAGGGF